MKPRLTVISDAEPDDLIAISLVLNFYRSNHIDIDSSNLLIIGCGRDAATAVHILQTIVDAHKANIKVVRGHNSKNEPFENVEGVFGKMDKVDKKEESDIVPSTQAMIDFSFADKETQFCILNLSTWRDLAAACEKINWKACAAVFISGGPNGIGIPSFNLSSDMDATKTVIQFVQDHRDIVPRFQLYGPLLYTTDMCCNNSCNKDTLTEVNERVMNSDQKAHVLIRKWIVQWDSQLKRDYPDFADKIAHLTKQFTPADVFPTIAWTDFMSGEWGLIKKDRRDCVHVTMEQAKDKSFTMKTKPSVTGGFERVWSVGRAELSSLFLAYYY